MIRLLFFFLVSASAAASEPIPVRTAEHGAFTRVVIDFRDRPDWTIHTMEDRLELRTSRPVSYDLEGVYRRIGDDRLARLSQTAPDTLSIALNCLCAANPTERPNGGLILDIAAGAPGPEGQPLPMVPVPNLLPGILTAGVVARPDASDVAAFRERLEQSFLAAATEGHIDAEIAPPAPDEQVAGTEETEQPLRPVPGPGLRVDSSAARQERGRAVIPAEGVCPPYASDPLNTWREAQVGPETLPQAEIEADARTLLARGLGAEALAMLESHSATDPLLREMAMVMDQPVLAPSLAATADCGPLVALFALLAEGSDPPARIAPVLTAMDGLDDPLKKQLGRRVMGRLVDLGRDEDARLVRNRIEGRTEAADPMVDFVAEHSQEAEPVLLESVARRTPELADAMARLIDGMVARQENVPVAILDQAQTLAVELSGQDRDRLDRSVIRARIAGGSLTAADGDLQRLARRSPDLADRLRIELFRALSDTVDDAGFLRRAVRLTDRLPSDRDLRLQLAERAEALHVPDLALSLLGDGTDILLRGESLVRARVAISRGAADRAENYLAGLSGPDVESLRTAISDLRVVAPEMAPPVPPTGVQARSTALLAESAALREEIRALIGD